MTGDKEDVVYTHNEISAIGKNNILPRMKTWVNLKGIILSEVSQVEKGKYHMTSHT